MTESLGPDGSTVLVRTENVWRSPVSPLCYVDVPTYNPCGLPLPRTPNVIPIKIETKMTLVDVNRVSMTSSVDPLTEQPAFDRYNNPIDVYEYDFGNGQIGAFIRRTHRSYADVPGSRILAVPSEPDLGRYPGPEQKKSLTQFEYDNYSDSELVDRPNASGHDAANFGPTFTARGNLTKVTSYSNAQNQTGPVSVKSQYDILGT
ncbi:MAG: hypothetical protein IPK58_21590 [Acidobacteria bacterium]|nr:hypothetical protein [Acidobacteriota bacterium]